MKQPNLYTELETLVRIRDHMIGEGAQPIIAQLNKLILTILTKLEKSLDG